MEGFLVSKLTADGCFEAKIPREFDLRQNEK